LIFVSWAAPGLDGVIRSQITKKFAGKPGEYKPEEAIS
jgi:hypothetical protein